MTERPILRFPEPRPTHRLTGHPDRRPRPSGGGWQNQGTRFQSTFDRLELAVSNSENSIELSDEPFGIAPERTLVFVTGAPVPDFARAARDVGLEVLSESSLDEYTVPEDSYIARRDDAQPTLYASFPNLSVLRSMLSLWRAFQRGDDAPYGSAPWWKLFDTLLELRTWGPEDRLNDSVRAVIEDRLPLDENALVFIEIELWPTTSTDKKTQWQDAITRESLALGGNVYDRSAIRSDGFNYEAALVGLPAKSISALLDRSTVSGLIQIEGVQFVMPQTIANSIPLGVDEEGVELDFEPEVIDNVSPYRALLLDGTPVAAHDCLLGGIDIEDIHDLVRLSPVAQREHATSMASLILRGDLMADGRALEHSRVLAVPILVDEPDSARSPRDRLLVDIVHTALQQILEGEDAIAPDIFVVNLSVGLIDSHFAGRVSALARLIDWWSSEKGVLFVISAGNVQHALELSTISYTGFDDATVAERWQAVDASLTLSGYERTLLAPAEAINALTVGALSADAAIENQNSAGTPMYLHEPGTNRPAIGSALGLGPGRAIKPDILNLGGVHDVSIAPGERGAIVRVKNAPDTGLFVASARRGTNSRTRTRGTSAAAALTTRALLQAGDALTKTGGPFAEMDLDRVDLALMTRVLAVNASRWPDSALDKYISERASLGANQHRRAKEEVLRHYGYGVFDPSLLLASPRQGVTLLGYGSIQKDGAYIFEFPLPESLSKQSIQRRLQITLAWFSPVSVARARYRLAALTAVASDSGDGVEEDSDSEWQLGMKNELIDEALVGRGSVWSRRLVNTRLITPELDGNSILPIRVQCRDASNGGLDPDSDIRFAIAVTLNLDTEVEFDIHQEVSARLRVPLRGA